MAAENLASISNALSQTFEERLARQWNRMVVTSSLIAARPDPGQGKNVAWDVAFSGSTALTVAEGSDVQTSEFNSDINVPATLPWSHYRTSFQISETMVDAAMNAGTPTALEDIFGERILGNGEKLATKINYDIINGTGTDGSGNATIIGMFGGSLDATGTYAGINRSTYGEWAGNVLGNGGTARPLTFDMLAQADQNLFTASGGDWEWAISSSGVLRKYEGLFTPLQRQNIDGRGPLQYSNGAGELFYKGRPALRDKDMPTGCMVLGTSTAIQVKYLPRRLNLAVDGFGQRMANLEGSNGDTIRNVTGIPVRITLLAKTGDSYKVSMKVTLQMLARRPNKFLLIKDISEV